MPVPSETGGHDGPPDREEDHHEDGRHHRQADEVFRFPENSLHAMGCTDATPMPIGTLHGSSGTVDKHHIFSAAMGA